MNRKALYRRVQSGLNRKQIKRLKTGDILLIYAGEGLLKKRAVLLDRTPRVNNYLCMFEYEEWFIHKDNVIKILKKEDYPEYML